MCPFDIVEACFFYLDRVTCHVIPACPGCEILTRTGFRESSRLGSRPTHASNLSTGRRADLFSTAARVRRTSRHTENADAHGIREAPRQSRSMQVRSAAARVSQSPRAASHLPARSEIPGWRGIRERMVNSVSPGRLRSGDGLAGFVPRQKRCCGEPFGTLRNSATDNFELQGIYMSGHHYGHIGTYSHQM
jgi:hypothetical protein